MPSPHKHKWLAISAQIIVSAAALSYVIYKIIAFDEWSSFFHRINENIQLFILLCFIQLILAVLNIFLESRKWQLLASVLQPCSFFDSLRQVLWGLQMGMITPGKVGEPIGKAALMKKGNRTQAFVLSVEGSVLQNIVIAIGGFVAFIISGESFIFKNRITNSLYENTTYYGLLILTGIILLLCVIYVFFRIFKETTFVKRIISSIQIIKKTDIKLLSRLFILTTARYLVFSFQLWFTLNFLGVISSASHIALIPIYYFIITIIPSFALADLGIRSSVALFIFGIISSDVAAIVSSIFIVWIFNLAFPSLVGISVLRPKKRES